MEKLHCLNLNPYILKWIHGYLTNRVVVSGANSSTLPVISDVPRGSVLGPLLFLIYINDVTCVVNNSGIVVFADDIALYKVIQSHLDYYLYYSLTLMPSVSLNINDIELSQVTAVKYLGITFTQDGIWSTHIDNICKTTRKVLGMIYRQFYEFSSEETVLNLYRSLVRPLLEYIACIIWDPYLKKDIDSS